MRNQLGAQPAARQAPARRGTRKAVKAHQCAAGDLDGVCFGRRRTMLGAVLLPPFVSCNWPGPASAAAVTVTMLGGAGGGVAPAPWGSLFDPSEQTLTNPGVAWSIGRRSKQLFYPPWLEGTWQVEARFEGVTFPLGQCFITRTTPGVLKASLIMALADVGAAMEGPVTFRQRFVASAEEGGVVADRPFNLQQQVDALLREPAVQGVEYAPLDNPTRLAVVYRTRRRDRSEISTDLRKAEVFINKWGSSGEEEEGGGGGGGGGGAGAPAAFACWENYRQVDQARAQGAVSDYLAAMRFTPLPAAAAADSSSSPARVAVAQRVAAFLQPQDAAYFEVGGRAVAIYNYSYDYRREGSA